MLPKRANIVVATFLFLLELHKNSFFKNESNIEFFIFSNLCYPFIFLPFLIICVFNNKKSIFYNVKENITMIPNFEYQKNIYELFQHVQLDLIRTYTFGNDYIALANNIIYKYDSERI